LLDNEGIDYPGTFATWELAYLSGDKKEGQNIRKFKSRARSNQWH
jgi:hypothetical protein